MPVPWPEIAAHRERLVRIARRRCPTREDAEDVVQEAMIRCATFEGLDSARLGQFLTTVTIRLCADLHRDAERGTRAVRRLDAGVEPSPEEMACAAAEAAVVREHLEALPSRQRDVLVDRAYGMSVTQISHRHALTYKSVESALSRARLTMRSALAGSLTLVLGAAGFCRRRPAVVVALPAATLILATTVIRAPHHEPVPPAAAAPPRVATGVAYEPPPPAVRRPVARAVAPVAQRPQRTMRSRVVVTEVREEPIADIDAAGISRTRITDTRHESEVEFVQRCIREGAWFELEIAFPEIEQNDGCGTPPAR